MCFRPFVNLIYTYYSNYWKRHFHSCLSTRDKNCVFNSRFYGFQGLFLHGWQRKAELIGVNQRSFKWNFIISYYIGFSMIFHAKLFKSNDKSSTLLITESFNFYFINPIDHISRDTHTLLKNSNCDNLWISMAEYIRTTCFLVYVSLQLFCYNKT